MATNPTMLISNMIFLYYCTKVIYFAGHYCSMQDSQLVKNKDFRVEDGLKERLTNPNVFLQNTRESFVYMSVH